jgi:predicted small secreted protein
MSRSALLLILPFAALVVTRAADLDSLQQRAISCRDGVSTAAAIARSAVVTIGAASTSNRCEGARSSEEATGGALCLSDLTHLASQMNQFGDCAHEMAQACGGLDATRACADSLQALSKDAAEASAAMATNLVSCNCVSALGRDVAELGKDMETALLAASAPQASANALRSCDCNSGFVAGLNAQAKLLSLVHKRTEGVARDCTAIAQVLEAKKRLGSSITRARSARKKLFDEISQGTHDVVTKLAEKATAAAARLKDQEAAAAAKLTQARRDTQQRASAEATKLAKKAAAAAARLKDQEAAAAAKRERGMSRREAARQGKTRRGKARRGSRQSNLVEASALGKLAPCITDLKDAGKQSALASVYIGLAVKNCGSGVVQACAQNVVSTAERLGMTLDDLASANLGCGRKQGAECSVALQSLGQHVDASAKALDSALSLCSDLTQAVGCAKSIAKAAIGMSSLVTDVATANAACTVPEQVVVAVSKAQEAAARAAQKSVSKWQDRRHSRARAQMADLAEATRAFEPLGRKVLFADRFLAFTGVVSLAVLLGLTALHRRRRALYSWPMEREALSF